MVRISGIDLPSNKRIEIALTYIFGIGKTSASKILEKAEISPDTRCNNLEDEEVTKLRVIIDEDYQTEGDLRRLYSLNIKRLTEVGSAAGRRHRVNLPVRGQRTRTNARTRKGKKSVVANKKR
uniref:ribosomal protein S13 n=1 Tax=Chrysotila carterae TaxID=13221 RepID=UPI0022F2E1E6|nr:ribosomal protein S13 [Chrysotila carterae]WAK83175.1 ribosomal protein S13 [Chrysotila carterae]